MTPGRTIMGKCSACDKRIAQYTIGSGNTFGGSGVQKEARAKLLACQMEERNMQDLAAGCR